MNHGVLPSVDGGAVDRTNRRYSKANVPFGQGNVLRNVLRICLDREASEWLFSLQSLKGNY
jgi:hypothetical protein